MAKINSRQFLEIWQPLNNIIRTIIRCRTNSILAITLDSILNDENLKAPFFSKLLQLLKIKLHFLQLD